MLEQLADEVEKGDQALQAARHTDDRVLRRSFLAATSPAGRRALQQFWQRRSKASPNAS